jgi:hypothetical protein
LKEWEKNWKKITYHKPGLKSEIKKTNKTFIKRLRKKIKNPKNNNQIKKYMKD